MADRGTRLAIVEAMIGEERRNGFEVAAMTRAVPAAVPTIVMASPRDRRRR